MNEVEELYHESRWKKKGNNESRQKGDGYFDSSTVKSVLG
jgi:hypothetical protein